MTAAPAAEAALTFLDLFSDRGRKGGINTEEVEDDIEEAKREEEEKEEDDDEEDEHESTLPRCSTVPGSGTKSAERGVVGVALTLSKTNDAAIAGGG